MFFRFPPDSHWNPERFFVGFGIGVGGYEGLVVSSAYQRAWKRL